MQIIADLQLHSKYSRAVSKEMTIPKIHWWAKRKGIHLLATGDWTHPLWMKEIEENLEETGTGVLTLKNSVLEDSNPRFILATEVSCIFTQGGKGRRVHVLIWVPTLESAKKINKEMTKQGCNLLSDGRPIIGLSCIHLAELVLSIEPKALIIPAHAWTPWFGMFGSMSGFDSLAEAFGPFANQVYAVETGLSSNPAMNWQIRELDHRAIVSFSDAHSGPKLGREATVFEFSGNKFSDLNYQDVYEAIAEPWRKKNAGQCSIAYTIEFYPEEGKYHFTGHRGCSISWGLEETQKNGMICPVCGKPLTEGVLQRVETLAGREENELELEEVKEIAELDKNVCVTRSRVSPKRPPFVMLVPLQEIIAECIGSPIQSKKTIRIYDQLIEQLGNEFTILLHTPKGKIIAMAGERIAQGIEKVRQRTIVINPGYDGVFGVVKLWNDEEEKPLINGSKEQLSLL